MDENREKMGGCEILLYYEIALQTTTIFKSRILYPYILIWILSFVA